MSFVLSKFLTLPLISINKPHVIPYFPSSTILYSCRMVFLLTRNFDQSSKLTKFVCQLPTFIRPYHFLHRYDGCAFSGNERTRKFLKVFLRYDFGFFTARKDSYGASLSTRQYFEKSKEEYLTPPLVDIQAFLSQMHFDKHLGSAITLPIFNVMDIACWLKDKIALNLLINKLTWHGFHLVRWGTYWMIMQNFKVCVFYLFQWNLAQTISTSSSLYIGSVHSNYEIAMKREDGEKSASLFHMLLETLVYVLIMHIDEILNRFGGVHPKLAKVTEVNGN
ncbi:hypothetical protein EGR_02419 [Echinococcus granulosus]|uniref:Uncharacterized protein n=1 Tax=Echinococcus granulosus TaxID=6210 RepID=W6UNA2_ECHGR|nr:hypothetical protein EGR_02419 [Echinococcus granulosus]EUB62623.1 hypothetical protein EGR_02419 [Echinococcus granulosus]